MKKFEELTLKDIKALYEEKFKCKVEQERLKRCRAEVSERYYCITYKGTICHSYDNRAIWDDFRYDTGNYFKTEEQAEEYKKKLLLQQAYKDWCAFDCDWNDDNQPKVFVYYDFISKDICCGTNYRDKRQGATYAQSKERIREFIDKIGEEDFIKYVLEVE